MTCAVCLSNMAVKLSKTFLASIKRDLLQRKIPQKHLRHVRYQNISSTLGGKIMRQQSSSEQINSDYDEALTVPSKEFVNRNPKNPEYFGYNKERGYSTQYKKRNFYKRLSLALSNRHVKAYVEDKNGNVLVKASTEEFDILRHLYKANDVSAATNIGHVIAQRCLNAGLNRVSMYTTDIGRKEKYKAFRKAVTSAGLQLNEPTQVIPPQTFYTGISVRKKRKGIIGMKMNNSTKRKYT